MGSKWQIFIRPERKNILSKNDLFRLEWKKIRNGRKPKRSAFEVLKEPKRAS